jgi:sterol desaturase/sphingolipid hydroxylase (fatty acid hydroxylase superfamily)
LFPCHTHIDFMSAPLSLEIFAGFAMFALIFVTLERCFPLRLQRMLRPGWYVDVTYYVTGCFIGRLSDSISLSAMLLVRWALGLNANGLVSHQPEWLQFIELVLLADFLSYCYHRAAHRYHWLWQFHKIHHSSTQMDWLVNVRVHPLDKIMGDCSLFIPVFILGFSDAPLLAYSIMLGFQGFLNHSNIKLDYGPLRWVIASPTFHHWHHCAEPEAYNKNFAPHLIIFDLLFRTAHMPRGKTPPDRYGIDEPIPDGFLRQTMAPFRKRNQPATTPKNQKRQPAILPSK